MRAVRSARIGRRAVPRTALRFCPAFAHERPMKPDGDGLLLDARLATMQARGAPYGLVERGALAWKDGAITFAGAQADLPDDPAALAARVESAHGALVTPGLVDCHTHLVF